MHRSDFLKILIALALLLAMSPVAKSQFKSEAFSNGFGGQSTASPSDSVETLFSLKEYFAGLSHKQDLKLGTLAGGSAVFIGGNQIYNKQYWKLPIVYTSIGAGLGGGFYFRNQYNKSQKTDAHAKKLSTICFAGSALAYWGTMMDGVINFKTDNPHHAGKATLYSILVPGLGQIYNGEYWKVPIYWGAISTSYAFYVKNKVSYERFRNIYNEATNPEGNYEGSIPAQTALYYRNIFRRYRDYSVLAIAASYLLQVIDANVFSYMQDFEVNDDITMNVKPAILTPDTQFAFSGNSALGVSIGLKF